jgi:hypothetical protein
VPGIDNLISATPTSGGGILGGVSKMFGGDSGLAKLAGGFLKLGLDSSMIGNFVPIILSFVESNGGAGVKAIRKKS